LWLTFGATLYLDQVGVCAPDEDRSPAVEAQWSVRRPAGQQQVGPTTADQTRP